MRRSERSSLGSALRLIALGLGGLVVTAALAELVCALVIVSPSGSYPRGLFSADAERGIALTPGFSGTATRAGHSFAVSVNEAGYRDSPWTATNTPVVLLIGSSAAFGVGLSREDSIAGQLAKAVDGRAVIRNTGVYSYGPPQVLATIQATCPRVAPRVVIYLHEYKQTRSDFLTATRPMDEGGEDSERPGFSFALVNLRGALSAHGLHPRQIAERFGGLGNLSQDYLLRRYAITTGPEFPVDGPDRAADIVRAMAGAVQRCNAAFLMAVLPAPNEAYYGLREPATEQLLAILKQGGGIDVVDLREIFERGSLMALSGLDYPNAAAARLIAVRLAGETARRLTGP